MKKIFTMACLLLGTAAMNAQAIDGIAFMHPKDTAVKLIASRFNKPIKEQGNKIVLKDVIFDGEQYDEANFFFDEKGRMNQARFKNVYKTNELAVKRMNQIEEKYGSIYKSSEDFDPSDGKFVIGYDKDGTHLYTISTFSTTSILGFGPF